MLCVRRSRGTTPGTFARAGYAQHRMDTHVIPCSYTGHAAGIPGCERYLQDAPKWPHADLFTDLAQQSYRANMVGVDNTPVPANRTRSGCHGDGVSETKARGGPVSELILKVREGTVSATQLSFTDILMCSLRLARLGSVLFLRLY